MVENQKINTKSEEIKAFEKQNRIKLPSDYVEFLLKFNGEIPNKTIFTAKGYGNSMFQKFYGIAPSKENNSIQDKMLTFKNRIPRKFIPIGCDMLGNQILLGVTDIFKDKIYFWWHENESDTKRAHFSNIYEISAGFNAFINSLEDLPESKSGTFEDYFEAEDNNKIIELIASGWDVNTHLANKITPLQFMVMRNNIEIVTLLLTKNANLAGTVERAITCRLPDMLELLLKAGADANEKDNMDRIPLHNAIMGGNLDAVKILLQYGADEEFKDTFNRNALDIAIIVNSRGEKEHMDEIIDLLK